MSPNPLSRSLNGLFVLNNSAFQIVYAPEAAAAIGQRVNLVAPPVNTRALTGNPGILRDVHVLFSGWGCPKIDAAFLDAAPNLRAVFYGAGSISHWITPAVWDRGIVVTSANSVNARPVAEYTVATIILSLKHAWRRIREVRERRDYSGEMPVPGNYRSTVGLISMGAVARLIVELLRPYEMTLLAYDPFLPDAEAVALGVTKVSLDRLFAECDVVSLHAPDLTSTRGLVTGALLDSMKPGATFINTARGAIVNEAELIEVMRARPDLQAILDVTQKEPPEPASALYELPNVVLTPHLAGSHGRECQRMGRAMVDELDRYLAGEPLRWRVRPDGLCLTAHASVQD